MMNIPLEKVGRQGRLEVRACVKQGQTRLAHEYCEIPFKVMRLYPAEGHLPAQLIVMNPTAGLLSGDHLSLEIEVESGARLLVTSQSACKVHPLTQAPALQSTRLKVKAGGELHYYLDPLIPFAGADWQQRLEILVEEGARFFFWDGISAGRVERGERWQFARWQNEMRFQQGTRLLYLERLAFIPQKHDPQSLTMFGGFPYSATGLIYGSEFSSDLCEDWQAQLFEKQTGLTGSIDSPEPSLMVVKGLFSKAPLFKQTFRRFRQAIAQRLWGTAHFPLRKDPEGN